MSKVNANKKDNREQKLELQIEGRNPILEALRANREIEKIYIAEGVGGVTEILNMASKKQVEVHRVDRGFIEKNAVTKVHQGVIAITISFDYHSMEDILKIGKAKDEPAFILILDHIQDPQNFGAIIRTAEACGVHGIIIPRMRAVGVTPSVIKASAGAIEHVPIVKVANISNAIKKLKKEGLWIVGSSMEGDLYTEHDFKGDIGVVVGSEGDGISRLVKENCDFLVRIPMKGYISSLNVSVATSVLLYEAIRQRG